MDEILPGWKQNATLNVVGLEYPSWPSVHGGCPAWIVEVAENQESRLLVERLQIEGGLPVIDDPHTGVRVPAWRLETERRLDESGYRGIVLASIRQLGGLNRGFDRFRAECQGFGDEPR